MNKSFKKIFKSDLAYHKNILITFLAISFLIFLPFIKNLAENNIKSAGNSFRYIRLIGYPSSEFSSYIPSFVMPSLIFLTMLMAIFAFFAPLILFDFFHGKEKIDFYHGLPVKREKLFLSKYFTGLLYIILPFFLVSSALILFSHFSLNSPEGTSSVFIFAIKSCIMGTLLYTFSVFFSCVTTNKLTQFLASFISIMSPMVLIFFLSKLTSVGINQALINSTYIFDFLSFVSLSKGLSVFSFSVVKAIIVVIMTLFILCLSLHIYKNFKSENSYKNITSKGFESFLSLCISFSASLLLIVFYVSISSMYYTRDNYNLIIWGLFLVFILCFFVLYYLFTALFEKNASLNIFNAKNVSIIILSSALLFSLTLFDTFNIKYRFPNPEKVKYAKFNGYCFSEKENIASLEEISRLMAISATGALYSDYYNSQSAFFEYIKDNKTVNRSYDFVSDSDILINIEQLFDSPEHKEDYIKNLNLLKNYNLGLDLYSELSKEMYGVNESLKKNNRYHFSSYTANEIIDALILDIQQDENFSPYRMQDVKISSVYFSTYNTPFYEKEKIDKMFMEESGGYSLDNFSTINIKPSYTNTINVIKQYFGEDYFDLPDDISFISTKRKSIQDKKDLNLSENKHFLNSFYENNLLATYNNNKGTLSYSDFETFLQDNEDVLSVETLTTANDKDEIIKFMLGTQFFYTGPSGFSSYNITPIYEDMDVYELYVISGDSEPTFFGTYLKPKSK